MKPTTFQFLLCAILEKQKRFERCASCLSSRQVTLLSNSTKSFGLNSQSVRFSLSKSFKGSCTFPVSVLPVSGLVSFCRSFLRTRRTAEEKFTTSTCVASCLILTMVRKQKRNGQCRVSLKGPKIFAVNNVIRIQCEGID